jgi:NADPH:quinone reductase-like Zn-dependent oxidoreductase
VITVRVGKVPGIDHLQVLRESSPGLAPGPGEIRVRIEASSLNAHDFAVASGRLATQPGRILLSDGAGIVEETGRGVTDFGVGDRVMSCFFPSWREGDPTVADFSTTPGDGCDGYAGEQVVRPAHWFTRAPRHMSSIEAATLPTAALTAWRAVAEEGRTKAGDTVLVLGTGGVSIFALQFAKAMGARVIATSSSDEKLKRVRALGADHVINYEKVPEWGKAVVELTNRRGADHIIEVGGPGTLPQSIRACRIGGHISLIGVLTGAAGHVPTALLIMRQVRMHAIAVGSRRHQLDMIRTLEKSSLKPVIDRTFALEDLAEAFRYDRRNAHIGKIAVRIGSAPVR